MCNNTKTCFSCLWSCGTYDTMHNQSKLYCLPEGYIARHKVADGICEYYKRGAGCDEPDEIDSCLCLTNINDNDPETGDKQFCNECKNTGIVIKRSADEKENK